MKKIKLDEQTKTYNLNNIELSFAKLMIARDQMTQGKLAGKSSKAYFEALIKTGKVKVQKVMANAQGTRMKSRVLSSGTALDPLRMKEQARHASDILMLNVMTALNKYKRDFGECLDWYFVTFTVANINKTQLKTQGPLLRRLGGELIHDIQRGRFGKIKMVGAYGSWELTLGDPTTLDDRLSKHDGKSLYHLHLHSLIAIDPNYILDEATLYSAWANKVNKYGFKTDKQAFMLKQISLKNDETIKSVKNELSELTKYVAKPDAFYRLRSDDFWHVQVFDEMYNFLRGLKRHPTYGLLRDINSTYNRYSKLVNTLLGGFYTQSGNNFLTDFLTEFNNLEFDASQNKVLITKKKVMTNAEIAYYNRSALKNIITDLTPESFDPSKDGSFAHRSLTFLSATYAELEQKLIDDSEISDEQKWDMLANFRNKGAKLSAKMYYDFDILSLAFEIFEPANSLNKFLADAKAKAKFSETDITERTNISRVVKMIKHYSDPNHTYEFESDLFQVSYSELQNRLNFYFNVDDFDTVTDINAAIDWRIKSYNRSYGYTFDDFITLKDDDLWGVVRSINDTLIEWTVERLDTKKYPVEAI